MDAALVHALLDEAAAWDPEYGGCPICQPTCRWRWWRWRGWVRAKRGCVFSARYAAYKQLVPARPRGEWPAGDAWRGRLGRRAAWPLYLDLFQQWIAHDGASEALSQLLPGLMPGVGAAAFHGLIRTAAGVRAGHAGEVAQGLAHWAAWYLPLGSMVPLAEASGRPQADPVRLLRQLHAGATGTGLNRMKAAAASGRWNAVWPLRS
ncbi:MAG: questin oxidase family protein [Rubrivivax sp.]